MNQTRQNQSSLYGNGTLLYIISFCFVAALVLLILGKNESWVVLFIWLPPLLVLRYLVARLGFFACCFNSFAILNLAYVYMLFDYVSASLIHIFSWNLEFPPVSSSFFLSLSLGSLFCSLGPFLVRYKPTAKVCNAASFYHVKSTTLKAVLNRIVLIIGVSLAVIILRASPGVIQLPLAQLFSFGFLFSLLPFLPRKLSIACISFFLADYICFFALANPVSFSFGNRTSALQPLFLTLFVYAMSFFSIRSSLVPVRAAASARLEQSVHQTFSQSSLHRRQENLLLPKSVLYGCGAVILVLILLIFSTISKFQTVQALSLSDAIDYYLNSDKAYSGLELRASIANLVYAYKNDIHLQFFQLLQLITSFFPSAWFAWKQEYDITPLLFQSGIYPQPLYFEPFLNQFADMGVVGPLFYAFFLFVSHSLYIKAINVSSRVSVFCWAAAQPLVIFSIVFFMQTPWHFARGSLFVMVVIAMISFVSRFTVLLPRNS